MSRLPLADVRVVDTTEAHGATCGRFLADLGADVVLVEPIGGVDARRQPAEPGRRDYGFWLRHANKRSVELDLTAAAGRGAFVELLAGADIWIDGHAPGELAACGLDPVTVHERQPHLVVAAITDFGLTGPRRDWTANDWVLFALGTQLSRSGVPGRPPFMLPGRLADETSSIQAAWAVLVALWHREHTGRGDLLDISRHEATAQIVDPAFGSIGTAAAQSGLGAPSGRTPAILYPIFPCADGYVRIVVLAPRQWRALRAWLGEPDEFLDPRFDQFGRRMRAADRLYPMIADLFASQPALDLVAEGQRRGVPIAPVLTPAEALGAEHFEARSLFVDVPVGDGRVGRAPAGHVLVDGVRAGIRRMAPDLGEHGGEIDWEPRAGPTSPAAEPSCRPLDGIRVLDLGVIVMGGEAGRLFADQGADVIKVENSRFPDGARGGGMTAQFAAGQRNKRSLALNLRDPAGRRLFERLVTQADVLLSNFKPGTLESLGLSPSRLRELNERLVVVTSSAMGESGPWRDWMGYGPLVRCVSGLTDLWCDPDSAVGFGDSTTIYPDHFVARVVDAAVLAALIGRRRTGVGAHVESSQAEAIIVALGAEFLRESLEPGSLQPALHGEADAPWGVYPCRGEEEWCVITVRDDADWSRLVDALDRPTWARRAELGSRNGRVAARTEIDEQLEAWTRQRSALDVMTTLQAVGIPAGAMVHVSELAGDPHLQFRGFFRRMRQPGVVGDVIVENGPCVAHHLPDPPVEAAPYYGEHTRAIARDLLDLDPSSIDAFIEQGVLDGLHPDEAAAVGQER